MPKSGSTIGKGLPRAAPAAYVFWQLSAGPSCSAPVTPGYRFAILTCMATNFSLTSNVVDIARGQFQPATIRVENGRIRAIEPSPGQVSSFFILPGFVDAHVHIESSMLVPTEFAREAVLHGTVATVSDPHEIGNVLGVQGVRYMLDNAEQSPLKIFFGAPSCVPATRFETAGAEINVAEVEELLDDPRIGYLSEMMNYPGVLRDDPTCLAKLRAWPISSATEL